MYQRLQRKLQKVMCTVDFFEYSAHVLKVKGWIFSEEHRIEDVSIVLKSKGKTWDLLADTGVERVDVYNHFKRNLHAKDSGFFALVMIKGIESGTVWLEYKKNGKKYKLYLGNIHGTKSDQIVIRTYSDAIQIINLKEFEEKNIIENVEKSDEETTVDIIIPVYNGMQYLGPLFDSIQKTNMKYRLIVIDDASPDERIKPYLRKYQEDHPEMILIENEENLGFVKSVNKGLKCSSNHVALVNTDVEVPEMWLERLMKPILENDMVATSTPYTNAGTICSFPNIGQDHSIYEGLSLETVDKEFKRIKPRYMEMPTGVGFCMGMNKKAIEKVGLLDEENFGKGYGEENDWCQRAIQQGMTNVHVENLFVYHKHGGSFLSEDKQKFIEEHGKILDRKYPMYYREVACYFELDPNKDVRKYVEWRLLSNMSIPTTLAFDHSLGGGATAYLEKRATEVLNHGEAFAIIRHNYDIDRIEVIYRYGDKAIKFKIYKFDEIIEMIREIGPREIIINELVSYTQLYEMLEMLASYKNETNVKLTLLGHDFYTVCPTINLLNEKEQYCGVPCLGECEECAKNNSELKYYEYGSMKEWRTQWSKFIKACDQLVVFSNDSKEIFEKAFGKVDNLVVIPHKIDYLPSLDKTFKHTRTLNIGLLGALVKHKGLEIVKETLRFIEQNNLNINIVLIGSCAENIKSKHFVETGKYTRDMLPSLIYRYDIDMFWIASIWPETFSYTTEEIMTMNFPVMSFDLGAPAERIKKYAKGSIIPNMTPEDVIATANEWNKGQTYQYVDKKVLFVVEEITFSSRYRVEHLREQLLYKGITSDCMSVKEAIKTDLSSYESIVVYRNSQYKLLKKLVEQAHKVSRKVFYDTDDLIFDYDSVADLDFLNNEYADFKGYCDNIRRTMQQCDGYITSTNTLAKQIAKCMDSEEVYVNRNVASAEMAIISVAEKCHVEKDSNKIVLGYFSGTKTHDRDFELIKDVLIEILEKHDNVYLRMGGQIKTAKEFTPYFDRIETFEFVSWKKLPGLISEIDINLMPLESTIFHKSKSENKWQEAALVGVPTIASYNEELSVAIVDGENGFMCKDEKEWKDKLERMIVDETLRTSIAEQAFQKVMKEYTTYTRDITEIVDVLCGQKD